MKKKYVYIAAIVLLLLISCLGYFYYLKKQDYKTGIPQTTETLIKIDTYRVIKDFGKRISKLKIDSSLPKGLIKSVKIPTNIFLYSVKGKKNTTFFGILTLLDPILFEETLMGKFQQEIISNSGLKKYVSKNGQITIISNENTAVFSYALEQDTVDDVLLSIIEKKNLIPVEKSSFKEILDRKEGVVVQGKLGEGHLNLEENILKGKWVMEQGKVKIGMPIQTPIFNSTNIFSFWLQADISALFPNKEYTVDEFKLSSDSLKSYLFNELQLEIAESVIQKDSIITYDYNDDFEKVEIVEVKESKVPGLVLRVKEQSNKLYNYLQTQGIIEDNKVNRKVFPLYEVKVKEENNTLVFTTLSTPVFSPLENSVNFFHVKADLLKMKKQEEFSFLSKFKYMNFFKYLEIKGYKAERNKILFELSITLL